MSKLFWILNITLAANITYGADHASRGPESGEVRVAREMDVAEKFMADVQRAEELLRSLKGKMGTAKLSSFIGNPTDAKLMSQIKSVDPDAAQELISALNRVHLGLTGDSSIPEETKRIRFAGMLKEINPKRLEVLNQPNPLAVSSGQVSPEDYLSFLQRIVSRLESGQLTAAEAFVIFTNPGFEIAYNSASLEMVQNAKFKFLTSFGKITHTDGIFTPYLIGLQAVEIKPTNYK